MINASLLKRLGDSMMETGEVFFYERLLRLQINTDTTIFNLEQIG